MFGRSFNDIGTAIHDKIISFNEEFEQTGKIINSWKNSDSIWTKLYPRKKNIESQLIDVDKLIPEIDESKASKILEFIKSIEDGTNEEAKSFQELYDTGNKTKQWIAEYGQSTKNQIRSTEGVINANKKARESAIAHNNALKQQTLGAKAATVATKALSVALNMVAMWAITEAIGAVVTYLNSYTEAAANAKEGSEALTQKMKDFDSTVGENAKTLKSLNSRYQELSEGVNELGGNVHNSTEEYEDRHYFLFNRQKESI